MYLLCYKHLKTTHNKCEFYNYYKLQFLISDDFVLIYKIIYLL